jgi:hypothetical protein
MLIPRVKSKRHQLDMESEEALGTVDTVERVKSKEQKETR